MKGGRSRYLFLSFFCSHFVCTTQNVYPKSAVSHYYMGAICVVELLLKACKTCIRLSPCHLKKISISSPLFDYTSSICIVFVILRFKVMSLCLGSLCASVGDSGGYCAYHPIDSPRLGTYGELAMVISVSWEVLSQRECC